MKTDTRLASSSQEGFHHFHSPDGEDVHGSFEVFWMREGRRGGSESGWYWWACFPGCLPDGDAMGPFNTSEEAHEDADPDDPQYRVPEDVNHVVLVGRVVQMPYYEEREFGSRRFALALLATDNGEAVEHHRVMFVGGAAVTAARDVSPDDRLRVEGRLTYQVSHNPIAGLAMPTTTIIVSSWEAV